jgi:hypothetical protein
MGMKAQRPPSLSTPTRHVQGLRKGKCGVYDMGLGRLKRVHWKPLGSSSQQALEALYAGGEPFVPERGLVEVASTLSEGCLEATIGDGSTPGAKAILGASIGDGSSPASSLEVTEAILLEGCLGAKIGDGSSLGRSLEVTKAVLGASIGDGSSPVRSLEVTKAVLGASEDGCPIEVGSSPVAVVSKDPKPSIPVNA